MMNDYAEYISRNHDKSKILRYMNLLWGLWGRDINRAALFIEEMVCHSGNGSKTIYIDTQKEKWLKEWLKDKQNAIYLKTGSIMLLKDFIEYIINGELANSEILEYIKNYADKQELRNRLVQEHFAIRTIGETEIGITDDGKPLYKKDYFAYRNMPFDDVLYRLEKAVSFVDEEINGTKEQIQVEPHQIPIITGTEQEIAIFAKAISKGYMVQNGNGYKWNLTKSLCAYMCGRLYCGDWIKEDETDYSRELIKGYAQLPRKELKGLFGFDVGANRGTMKEPPRNVYKIEDLFNSKGKP